jgi:hypothetical protein
MLNLKNNPKYSENLIFRKQNQQVLVRNKVTKQTFTLGKVEYEILSSLTGEQSLVALKAKFSKYTGHQFERYLLLLSSKSLLESETVNQPAFNPLKILVPLTKSFHFLKKGLLTNILSKLLLSGIFVLGATVFFLRHHLQEIIVKVMMTNYFRWDTLLIYLISVFAIGIIHESDDD